jgi:AcrR family transcriptional regulator
MNTDTAPRRSVREDLAAATRERAMEGVAALLRSGSDVTFELLALEAGVPVRTLYRYFPTRDALLHEAGARVQAQLALPIDIDAPADIPSTFWAASARMAEHPQRARALARSAAGRAAHAATRGARVSALQAVLAELTAGLPEPRARQIAGVITHLCSSTAWVGVADESLLSDDDARAGVRWALIVLLDAARAEAAGSTTDPTTTGRNTMSVSMTCGPCGTVIAAADEDQLVTRVQQHAREHDGAPDLSREHILAHLRGENPEEPS